MQAVIIAGGEGTRLTKHGISTPKSLLRIGSKSLLEIQIENLYSTNVREILLLLRKDSNLILNELEDIASRYNIKFDFKIENSPKGTGGALVASLDKLDSVFYVIYGDILFDTNIESLITTTISRNCNSILTRSSNHIFDSDLIMVNHDSRVLKYFGKPHTHDIHLMNIACTGIFSFLRSSVELLKIKYGNDKFELDREGIPWLIEKNQTFYSVLSAGFVKDIGTPERLSKIDEQWKNRKNWRSPCKAVFLDRDGVITNNMDNYACENKFKVIEGFVESIDIFRKLGYKVFVLTNQPAVAKGFISWESLCEYHGQIDQLLAKNDLYLDGWTVCPHHPEAGHKGEISHLKIQCVCRKPNTGLFQRIDNVTPIFKPESWMVGDSITDYYAAMNFGINFAGIENKDLNLRSENFENLLAFAKFLRKNHRDDNF